MAMRSSVSVLKRLRALMKVQPEGISAYIIPHSDAHMNEYISSNDARLEFLSGFTGSCGTAIITEEHAALWTDGRYHSQAEKQLGQQWTLMKEGLSETLEPHQWLSKVLPAKGKVGVDSLLISYSKWTELSRKLGSAGHKLVPVSQNLVDSVWDDRPPSSETPVEVLPVVYTGRTWQEKLSDVRQDMKEKNAQALIVTALDETAWLFNLRGGDIEFNPVFFAYAVITMKSAHLFVDENKITAGLEKHLTLSENQSPKNSMDTNCGNGSVDIQPYWMFKDFLTMFMQQQSGRIWVSPSSSYGIVSSIPEERRLLEESPIQLRKAVKNPIEIEGMKKAHVRDAVALIEFLDWMEKEVPKGGVTEISAADKLESLRRQQSDYVGLSFATISASGPNAAVIHYKPSRESDRPVTTDEIYLVDSGGQYRDGTTDVTRTVHFGVPTDKERECYTRVVKGAIALSTTKFPRLTKGNMIDTLARKSLWDVGLDYMHGTGHGVGAYLNVHEGPFSISFKENPKDPGLREGMFTSIEPGYYEDSSFGIRLENIAQIVFADTKYQFKQKQFLTFETITLVPVQKKLLNPTMLTEAEIEWLNTYHEQCRLVVGQVLEDEGKESVLQWLMRETQPLG
ncbi:xaa-Pro aminopeptidase 1 [Galendromus occidentalis]|uniref:Xaa-Pro aminopeptidase 1 n=1 Tax=Galendromus occidentalis TaxID=34638 RepID=A0AAJ7L4U7_9ACAR|nr:xaa-Pro aminopeptidase 1 [Galendromus occidentalis]